MIQKININKLVLSTKLADGLVNCLKKNHLWLFLVVSISLFLAYGIDIWQYIVYNIDVYIRTTHLEWFRYDASIQMLSKNAVLLNIFTKELKFFLQTPFALLISSVFIKTLIFLLVYKITQLLIKDDWISLLTTLLFLLSTGIATHGLQKNGMWLSPLFFRASVSAALTLGGIYFALNYKHLFSTLFFALSMPIVTACPWFTPYPLTVSIA